jgi:amino acid adenylation domain-containing protein
MAETSLRVAVPPPSLGLLPFDEQEVEGSLPQRFARVAATWPARPAIVAGSDWLTYEALDRRSDALAQAIQRRAPAGAGPVAVLLGDHVSSIISILATWKAGRLCVPVDPGYPPARIEMLLKDSEATLVVAAGEAVPPLRPPVGIRQLRPGDLDLDRLAGPPSPVSVPPDGLAYLFYTSGSTGEPKGVPHSHRNLLHRVRFSVASLGVGPEDRMSALHSLSFFVGLRDILNALLSGAALLPFDPRRAGAGALAAWIDREQVSVLSAVATTLRHLIAHLGPEQCFPSVRIVRCGGEPLHRSDVERWWRRFPSARVLIASYGATEAGHIAEYPISRDTPLPAGRVPAGHSLGGIEVLILDEGGRPVDDGQPGEVVVRSAYLSAGYWRRPDLTGAVFVPDPDDPRSRLYHTGDIGRRRSDGCLEVLGRRDQQVKVRGYRVHPGEIELTLAEHPDVHEAVVTARAGADGGMRLTAYVVPRPSAPVRGGALRQFLRERLPGYMVPSAFIPLEVLPVNAHGKLDRAALPPPTAGDTREAEFVRPRSPLEHQIVELWEELLGVRPIGSNDDFFDLGGDSLLAATFATAFEAATDRPLSPGVLFESSTVAALAEALVQSAAFAEPVTALRPSGNRPPLFFLHGDFNGGGLYCHALARALDPDRPFYAVHPHGLDGRPVPATIEAMAADRLEAVRALRRHGPFLLGGHCNGGLVALEMARRLRAEGADVEMVVLIEVPAPGQALGALRWASGALGRAAVAGRNPVRAARGLARAFVGRTFRRGPGAPRTAVAPFDRLRLAYRHAMRRYVPPPYPGRVALVRGEAVPEPAADLAWSSLLPRLELVVVPGDHLTCVTRHVAGLGARLDELLRSSKAG